MHHDARRIEEFLETEAIAVGAGAGRVVEREQLGLERRHAVATLRAGVAAGERELVLLAGGEGQARHAVAEAQRGLEGFGQPLRDVRSHLEPVDHGLDVMLAPRIEILHRVDLAHHAVGAHAH